MLEGAASPEDAPDIAASFQKAAEQGDAVAALNLGLWFGKGGAGAPDEREAAKWMRLAADKLPMAQYLHGRMLAEGRGEEPDFEAARALFARAADSGLVDAEAALAEMMLNGRGGPRDVMGAVKLFQKAARGGHGGAMYALGALCAGGHGIPANLPLAQRWFKGAAELGNPHAQLMLSRYLSSGVAGEIDPRRRANGLSRPPIRAWPKRRRNSARRSVEATANPA